MEAEVVLPRLAVGAEWIERDGALRVVEAQRRGGATCAPGPHADARPPHGERGGSSGDGEGCGHGRTVNHIHVVRQAFDPVLRSAPRAAREVRPRR